MTTARKAVPDIKDKLPGEAVFRDTDVVERADDRMHRHYTTREIVARIWREHLLPHRKLLILAILSMLVASAMTGLIPVVIKKAVHDIFLDRNEGLLYGLAAFTLMVTLIKTVTEYISKTTMAYLGNRFITDLRLAMFEKLAYADMKWLESTHSGLFLSGFLNDTGYIRDTASRVIIAIGENATRAVFLALAMIWLDPGLSFIVLSVMPIAIFSMNRQRKKMFKATKKTLQETGDMSRLITQMIRSIRVVRAYGRERHEIKRTGDVMEQTLKHNMKSQRARGKS